MDAMDPKIAAEHETARTLAAAEIAPEEIADLMGRTLDWVYVALGLRSLQPAPVPTRARRPNNKLSGAQWEALLSRYHNGERAEPLALEHGIVRQTIHNYAHYRGVKFNGAHTKR